MSDLMTFPNTVEEFMEQYKIIDTEQVYTNGAELVPIFRMEQWFEHLSTTEPMTGLYVVGFNDGYKAGKEDAEPRKGKWEAFVNEDGELDLKCSVCGKEQGFYFCYFNFCPNCGARMEERDGKT